MWPRLKCEGRTKNKELEKTGSKEAVLKAGSARSNIDRVMNQVEKIRRILNLKNIDRQIELVNVIIREERPKLPDGSTTGSSETTTGKTTTVTQPDKPKITTKQNDSRHLVILDSVTSIGLGAFYGNQLTSVIIPDSVTSIGWSAFYNNNLTKVILSASLYKKRPGLFGKNFTSLKFYEYDTDEPDNKGCYLGADYRKLGSKKGH